MHRLLALTALTLCFIGANNLISAARAAEGDTRLFELRTYTCNEGKLPELHKRFREHTNKLFEKHGMTLIGYWTPAEGAEAENTLVYILAYPDKKSRDESWKAFMADPEWQAAYKASHLNGPLVKKVDSKFLSPTDYSAIK
jgi:hypothetical protein